MASLFFSKVSESLGLLEKSLRTPPSESEMKGSISKSLDMGVQSSPLGLDMHYVTKNIIGMAALRGEIESTTNDGYNDKLRTLGESAFLDGSGEVCVEVKRRDVERDHHSLSIDTSDIEQMKRSGSPSLDEHLSPGSSTGEGDDHSCLDLGNVMKGPLHENDSSIIQSRPQSPEPPIIAHSENTFPHEQTKINIHSFGHAASKRSFSIDNKIHH